MWKSSRNAPTASRPSRRSRGCQPDLVLLDVEMPGLGGFEVVEMLGSGPLAGHRFRDRVRSVRRSRLRRPGRGLSLEARRSRTAARRPCAAPSPGSIASGASPRPPSRGRPVFVTGGRRWPEWLLVKSDGRSRFLRVRDIDWIESQKNDVMLHVGPAEHLYHLSTSGIEARLDPARFLRIHRSTIVNIERIKDLYPLFNGDYGVTLKDGTTLTMSSTYRRRLAAFRDGMI